MKTLTKEEELHLVYKTLKEAYECVSNDDSLSEFVESANNDLNNFQENYPEIVEEYKYRNLQHNLNKESKC